MEVSWEDASGNHGFVYKCMLASSSKRNSWMSDCEEDQRLELKVNGKDAFGNPRFASRYKSEQLLN